MLPFHSTMPAVTTSAAEYHYCLTSISYAARSQRHY